MFSKIIFEQIRLIFIHILLIYFTYLMAENANQTKCCALNFTKCFVSHLSVPDEHHE